jgi:hypothetical protein
MPSVSLFAGSLLVSLYPVLLPDVTSPGGEGAVSGLPGMLAVRVADLAWPARPGGDGRSALVAAGAGKISAGDRVVFFRPVVITAAVVRRTGGCRLPGIRLIMPAWEWPRTGSAR